MARRRAPEKGTKDSDKKKDFGDNAYHIYQESAYAMLDSVVELDMGSKHMLALTNNAYKNGDSSDERTVYAWGDNVNGQLGDGTTTRRRLPVKVKKTNGTDVITTGTITYRDNDGVDQSYTYPTGKIAHISAGETFSMLLTEILWEKGTTSTGDIDVMTGGTVWAWGSNANGQLGIVSQQSGGNVGSDTIRLEPVEVLTGANTVKDAKGNSYLKMAAVQSISAGGNHGMVVSNAGYVFAWGDNRTHAQLGDFTQIQRSEPVKVGALPYRSLEMAHAVHYKKWNGTNWTEQVEYQVGAANHDAPPLSITMYQNELFIGDCENMRKVYYKGFNLFSDTEVTTLDGKTAVSLSVSNEEIVNAEVKLGTDNLYHIYVEPKKGAFGRSTVTFYIIEKISDTEQYIYSGSILVIVLPDDGVAVPMVAAGRDFTLALRSDGTVWAWGNNEYGQLGTNLGYDTTNRKNENDQKSKTVPVQVIFPKSVDKDGNEYETLITHIAAGGSHGMAVTAEGKVLTWGLNSAGQLGNNQAGVSSSTPVFTKGLNNQTEPFSNALMVSAGEDFSMVLTQTGEAYVWGRNNVGQLGISTTSNSPALRRLGLCLG